MMERVRADINLAALRHNLQIVKSYAARSAVLAMVKANAYGHGLLQVASALSHADALGVHCVEEAMMLRRAGFKNRIVVMIGFCSEDELATALTHQLEVVIHRQEQLELLERKPMAKPLTVWLKIDTGMHRLGIAPERLSAFMPRLQSCTWVKQPVHLMTHLADADDINKSTTREQLVCFKTITTQYDCPKSVACSGAIISLPESHEDWVRPGIMLYGASPLLSSVAEHHDLKPVMTLRSKIVSIHHYQAGAAIGYGGTWRCPEEMLVGVVSIGYGDGYPRHAKNGTPVLVNGNLCALAGRVSMDMITVDLRGDYNAQVGDEVILWGEGLPVETVARCSDTIAYELFCRLTSRVNFNYIDTQGAVENARVGHDDQIVN